MKSRVELFAKHRKHIANTSNIANRIVFAVFALRTPLRT